MNGLLSIPRVRLRGRALEDPGLGLVSFTVEGLDSGELAAWLDRDRGIMVRAGLHCAPAAHRRLGSFPDGTVRAGIGPFNTERDIDRLVEAVGDAARTGIR